MKLNDKIFIAGRSGMVGSAIERNLVSKGYTNIIGPNATELDLRDQQQVDDFFIKTKPDYVFLAAAHVGGILANQSEPATFLYDNLMIEANVIHAAAKHHVSKLLFLGSSCIYPKLSPQPIKEEYLLTGMLESTNESYAIAKIAGIKLCEAYSKQFGCNFIAAMPCNLYGPNDNYDLNTSHVIPALLQKIHNAKVNGESQVTLWGTGSPLREFLHVDDAAEGCVFMMLNYQGNDFLNMGYGEEISIKDLASAIAGVVGFNGQFHFDTSKPDGTPRKLMDSSTLLALGWKPTIRLVDGLTRVYRSQFQ